MPDEVAVCFLSLLILWSLACPGPCLAQEPSKTIKFAVYPYKSPKSVIALFGPIAARFEKKLGKKVQLVSALDTKTFLEKGRRGVYDIALPSPSIFFKIRSAGYKVIARGSPAFYGGAVVRLDSDINTIEQLKGKRVAAIGEHSYAGYIFILSQLVEKKIDPQKDVDIQFLGKVDSIIYGVANKKYDVGLLRLDALETPNFVTLKNHFRVIARSPEIPQYPFVVKSSMDAATVAAIREVLTGLSPDLPEDLIILKSLQINKIVAATDADYDQFYKFIKKLEYFKH